MNSLFTPNKNGKIALVISSYQPNKKSSQLLRIAIDSMLKFKPDYADIWVIDVGSPYSKYMVMPKEYSNVNFIFTDYTPRSSSELSLKKRFYNKTFNIESPRNGSIASGWTLDFAIRSFNEIKYYPKYFFTLHMDIMFTNKNIIPYMLSLFEKKTAAVGVLKQKNISKQYDILHSLGCLWNYDILLKHNLLMETKFPKFDVGEFAIFQSINYGYSLKNLECSYNNMSLENNFSNKYKSLPGVDRSIDNEGNVIFMHLGRGVSKSEGLYWKNGKTTVEDWAHWFNSNILTQKDNHIENDD